MTTIGESDCEFIGSGLLAQPVNAVSSLAYAVFGGVVLLGMSKAKGRERTYRFVFGILLIATGIGSVLFHGPQGPGSKFLHDVTFLLTLLFIAIMSISGLMRWTGRVGWVTFFAASALISVLLTAWPSSTNLLAGTAAVVLVASDVLGHRAGVMRMRWWAGAVVAMGIAVLMFVAGRTGSPLCDSASLFQGHSLWHVLSAGALWSYFESTTKARVPDVGDTP